ncbi:MAG: hypothetical protein QGG33_02725, partial [Candidatus Krumholzibacteria bacterium]|nr:hypothetical protein [Candidatus Krumholzibacteria bacterium]
MKYFLGLFVLIALVVALVLCQGSVPDVRDPVVRVFGGAGEVSGSLSIVDLGQTQIMVDCGAYYPHGSGTAEKRAER